MGIVQPRADIRTLERETHGLLDQTLVEVNNNSG